MTSFFPCVLFLAMLLKPSWFDDSLWLFEEPGKCAMLSGSCVSDFLAVRCRFSGRNGDRVGSVAFSRMGFSRRFLPFGMRQLLMETAPDIHECTLTVRVVGARLLRESERRGVQTPLGGSQPRKATHLERGGVSGSCRVVFPA